MRSISACSAYISGEGATPAQTACGFFWPKAPTPDRVSWKRRPVDAVERIGDLVGDMALDIADEAQGEW